MDHSRVTNHVTRCGGGLFSTTNLIGRAVSDPREMIHRIRQAVYKS